MIHTVVSVPLAFLVNIVIARVLGVVDYGRLAFLSTIMDIAGGIISLGIGVGLMQFGAKAHAAGRIDAVKSLLSKTQGFRLLIEAPVIAMLIVLLANVPAPLMIVAVLFGVLLPAALGGANACLGIESKTAEGAQNAMVINLFTQGAVLAAVFWIGTADAVWTARLAVAGVGAALAMVWIAPAYRRAVLQPHLPRQFPSGFWRFSLPAGLAGIVGTFAVSRTEVLGLTFYGQPEQVGLFALAFGLANHIFSPAQALLGPLVPAVTGLREVDPEAVTPAFQRTIRASSTIVGLMVAVGVPTLAALIPLIYGAPYVAAVPIFMALGIASGLQTVSGPVHAFVQARLEGGVLLRVNIIALAVDLLFMVLFIPSLGAWGAVIANVSAALVRLLMLVAQELRGLEISWRLLGLSTLPFWTGTIAALAGCLPIYSGVTPAVSAVAGLAIGSLGFLALLRVTRSGLTASDGEAIVSALPARFGGLLGSGLRLLVHVR